LTAAFIFFSRVPFEPEAAVKNYMSQRIPRPVTAPLTGLPVAIPSSTRMTALLASGIAALDDAPGTYVHQA